MSCPPCSLLHRLAAVVSGPVLLLSLLLFAAAAVRAQDSAGSGSQTAPQGESKTFVSENGTQIIDRNLQTERRKTSDGEVEIQRYRTPGYAGDNSISWEREVRTRKLPDGTIEKETILRNPDGGNHMEPVQVVREKITKTGDTTATQRDVLQPNYDGRWQPIQRETITEKGTDKAKRSVKEVQMPNTSGDWQTVERDTTASRSSAEGKVTESVRQLPDASGRLADYERREERSAVQSGKEAREITVQRRDLSDTDGRQFLLVEHTKESTATAAGTTVRHITTESDFLAGGFVRASHPELVEERTVREKVSPDGSKQVVTTTNAREPGDPTALRPTSTVVQQTDTKGYVRQIFIPAQ